MGKVPFGASNPSRVPWPPATMTAATLPARNSRSPEVRAVSRARFSSGVLGSGIYSGSSGRPACGALSRPARTSAISALSPSKST